MSKVLIILAGLPPIIQYPSGKLCVTTAPAPTMVWSPPDVKIETTFFSEKIFQHHTMQLPSKTAQKKNL